MSAASDNKRCALELARDDSWLRTGNLVGGKWRDGGKTFETHSPTDGESIREVASSGPGEVAAACEAAAAAFANWRDTPGEQRKQTLHAIADAIMDKAEEIALVESLDTGQPLRFMRKAALRGAENFRFFADRAPSARDGLSLPTPTHMNLTSRTPIGPVGVITPWNTPFMLSTWKVAPALAAGCTVVHKPAEWAPLSACVLAGILDGALPDGAFNVVHGMGETAGVALTEHPDVKAIAFVGESATGSRIMAQGAPTLKRSHFELGGKNPVIVFDDADLDRAVDAAVFMIYSLNGERCTSSSRMLVQETVYDEVVGRVAKRARAIKVGDPLDPDTELGPLIHPDHLSKVAGYLKVAAEEGANIAAGGNAVEGPGNFVEPTLLAGVAPHMRVAKEEIFGPVLCAIPFKDEGDAVKIANDTGYGLAAYIWSGDGARALRVADRVEAGMVWVNSENVRHLPTPFGGMKASGIGRDGGDYSFDFFMEQKNVCVALGDHAIPRLGKEGG